ncbi:hypothetical protein JW851_04515 [Candidatus Woesearchaeota archaeon]|nr:hypothetical protein [Candidatus Woesearchaeota archaeon]
MDGDNKKDNSAYTDNLIHCNKLASLFKYVKKIKIEFIFLIIFLIIMLKFMSFFNAGLLEHDAPFNYNAGDMFTCSVYAEMAKLESDISHLPFYLSQGTPGVITTFSMISGIIAGQLSLFTGLETHEFIMHSTLLFIVLSTLMVFYFLKKIDLRLAILSLPLSLLVFKWPFQYTITWGMCLSPATMLFAVVGLFCILHLNKRYMFIFLGIMNGAGFLAHARETLMFNTGVALYFLVRFLKEKILQKIIKNPKGIITLLKENVTLIALRNYILSIPIMLLMMFHYIPILFMFLYIKSAAHGYAQVNSILIQYMPPWLPHHVYLWQFGFFKYLLIIGIIIGLGFLIFKKIRTIDIIISVSFMFAFNGLFSVLGNKTTQIGHLFPILLMPITGLTLFIIYLFLKKIIKIKLAPVFIFSVLFLATLIPTYMYHAPTPLGGYAFADPYTWEAFKWVRDNVDDDEKILVLYGDRYNQETVFYMMLKNQFRTYIDYYVKKASEGVLTSTMQVRGFILAETFFKENGTYVEKERKFVSMMHSLCNYEYLYTDKVSRSPPIQKYTLKLLEKLINENNFVPVFQNNLVVILKNNNLGGDCFEDEALS